MRHFTSVSRILIAIFSAILLIQTPAHALQINEIVSSNDTGLVDEDGAFEDWIELYNPGTEAVDLSGWGLSDNPDKPLKWKFPEDVSIEAGEFLLIFASGKDRQEFQGWEYDENWASTLPNPAAGLWLFDEIEDNLITDASGNDNAAILDSGQQVTLGKVHAMKFDDWENEFASIPNDPTLQTTGSIAISLWLNPASIDRRQNPWDKAYGGEGTINVEVGGRLNFLWGTSGSNTAPYQAFNSSVTINPNEWTHAVIVRDLDTGKLRWYINGVETANANANYSQATASSNDLRIGRGYAGSFDGMIALPMLLPYALSAEQVETLYLQTRGAFEPRLHTNFSLSSDGEPVILSQPDGTEIDSIPAIALRRDISYGRSGNDPEQFFVFDQPTPLTANPDTGYLGVLPNPEFSTNGGFHPNSFSLSLSASNDADILYTLDGSHPRQDRLTGETYHYKSVYPQTGGDPFGDLLEGTMTTHSYDQPVWISDRSSDPNRLTEIATSFLRVAREPAGNIRKATVIRAQAVKPGYLPSEIVTHTYFVGPDVSERFDLPVVSLSTDDANLFDYERGIYVPGKLADDWRKRYPNYNPATWMIDANYWEKGPDWERPINMEYFLPDGQQVISQELGARTHGGASRTAYRKSLRLYPRSRYGESRLNYPLFPNLDSKAFPGQPVTSFKRLILRNSGNDSAGMLYKDALIQNLLSHLPIDIQAWQPAIHYINGESWGLINLRERLDVHYLSSHYGIPIEDLSQLDNWTATRQSGDPKGQNEYRSMVSNAEESDPNDPGVWADLVSKIDISNHALYHAIEIYTAHNDWPHNNIGMWKKMTPNTDPDVPYGHDGRWRWLVFDLDLSFTTSNASLNSLTRLADAAPGSSPYTGSRLFRVLFQNPEYQHLLISHLADLMNATFTEQRVADKVAEFNALMAHSRAEQFQRWQSGGTVNTGGALVTFAQQRPAHMRQHVIDYFQLAGTYPLTVDTPTPEAGSIRVNSLKVDENLPGHPTPSTPFPWTGTYFQDVAVSLEALPAPGYQFVGWLEHPEETSASVEVTANSAVTWTALFEPIPQATIIHAWNFESDPLATPSFTIGGANLDATLTGNSQWIRHPADNNLASDHLRINEPLQAELLFTLPTTGLEQITFEFDTRRSGQAAGLQTLSYSLDGLTWSEFATYPVKNTDIQHKSFDFSGIPGANDNPDFALRISFQRSPDQITEGSGLAGNHRFDNIQLTAFLLPGTELPMQTLASLELQEIIANGQTLTIDLAPLFHNPIEGSNATYSVQVQPAENATAIVQDNQLKIDALRPGNAHITIQADNGTSPAAESTFSLLIYPTPHPLAANDYLWREWSPQEPAGHFPPHMIFLQGSGNKDSDLHTVFPRAYEIPATDAANEQDSALPYAASTRTRINGLDQAGIAFINTGRERDLGAALLALDTTGTNAVHLSWVAGTVLPNERSYALRLQARTSLNQPFQDVIINGQPVEYLRNPIAGHQETFGPIELPQKLLGKSQLQLIWRYHHTAGDSGPRAQLSLDDILVTSGNPRSYDSWRLLHFPDPAQRDDDEISGPMAESENVQNLLRYALGLNRTQTTTGFVPFITEDSKLRFRYDPEKTDLIYQLIASDDLQDWSEIIYDSEIHSEYLPQNGYLEIPISSQSARKFYRLKVSLKEDS